MRSGDPNRQLECNHASPLVRAGPGAPVAVLVAAFLQAGGVVATDSRRRAAAGAGDFRADDDCTLDGSRKIPRPERASWACLRFTRHTREKPLQMRHFLWFYAQVMTNEPELGDKLRQAAPAKTASDEKPRLESTFLDHLSRADEAMLLQYLAEAKQRKPN